MPYDKTKFHRYQGDPLIPMWVMDAIRSEAAAAGLTVNQQIAAMLSWRAGSLGWGANIKGRGVSMDRHRSAETRTK